MSVKSSVTVGFSPVLNLLVLLLLGSSLAVLTVAQEKPSVATAELGAIRGTITDPAHAGVPDAEAVLTSATDAGANLAIPVDNQGAFSVTGIVPGTYTLTVSAPGFADKVFEGIAITPGLPLKLDASLKPASAKTSASAN